MTFVKRVHDLVSGNTPEAQAARALAERRERTEKELAKEREKQGFRKDMPLHRTYFHEIPSRRRSRRRSRSSIDWTSSAEFRELHPIMQAARVQHGFIQIFPFTENSGKVGRLLTNFLLLRNRYWPVVVVSVDRQKYYESFRGSVTAFASLLMDSMENSLDNGLKYFRDLVAGLPMRRRRQPAAPTESDRRLAVRQGARRAAGEAVQGAAAGAGAHP